MNTITLRRTIRTELEALNRRIDQKILRGLSYANEARRHKFLLARLYDLNRQISNVAQRNWFSRSFGLVSTFLF